MNTFHILNGDCLSIQLTEAGLDGKFIVIREALVEGPLNAGTLNEFFALREKYLTGTHGLLQNEYRNKSINEFEKFFSVAQKDLVYLWFEDDLFCQANMWFILSLLQNNDNVFRIFPLIPAGEDKWKGFGISTTEMLLTAYRNAVKFSQKDLEYGKLLWDAFRNNNLNLLKELGSIKSDCFHDLPSVITAHIERFSEPGRPERSMKEIISGNKRSFEDVFTEFSKREGVYGFSDVQVRKIFESLQNNSAS